MMIKIIMIKTIIITNYSIIYNCYYITSYIHLNIYFYFYCTMDIWDIYSFDSFHVENIHRYIYIYSICEKLQ